MLLNIIDDICDLTVWIAEPTFDVLVGMGMGFNWLLFAMGGLFFVAWMKKMRDYDKRAEENGTPK